MAEHRPARSPATAGPAANTGGERFAATVLRHSPDLVLVVAPAAAGAGNARWLVGYASPVAATMLGRSPRRLAGRPVAGLVHDHDEAALAEMLDAAPAGAVGASRAWEIRLSHADGRWVEVEVAVVDLRHDPDVGGVVLHARQLSKRRADDRRRRRPSGGDGLRGPADRGPGHEEARRRLDLQADLRRAIDGDELVLHYQPIVDLATGAATGVEVLVRWQRPGGDLVYPGEFVAVAEESGLVRPMGRWVLAEACRQQKAWAGSAPPGPSLDIAVNVSPVQVDDAAFVDDVAAVLAASGTEAGGVTLEITESVLIGDFDATVERLVRLRRLGVTIAIDDFGTGWSSFSRLKDLPVDVLKIDKAFVDGVTGGPEDSAVAQAIVKLGRTLGLQTVAEGIELPGQAERLATMGCDMGQGYLFSPPLPAERVPAVLRRLVGGRAQRG